MRVKSFRELMAAAGLGALATASADAAPPVAETAPPAGGTPPPPPPPPSPPPPPPPAASQEDAEVVALADAQRGVTEARAAGASEGAAAERARWNAVLSSEEGRAHSANATFLLNHSAAKAEDIIAQLKGAPAPAAAAPAGAAAPAAIPDTKVDLTGKQPGATASADGAAGGADADAIWAEVQGTGKEASMPAGQSIGMVRPPAIV